MQKVLILVSFLVVLSVNLTIADSSISSIDSLDSVFLSQLKFILRHENPLKRCQQFLNEIKIKLEDETSEANLLLKISESLRRRNSRNLADFTDNCYKILAGDDVVVETKTEQQQQLPESTTFTPIVDNIPYKATVDWRRVDGRVSRVKDQGSNCKSSWAFATTGVLEGQLKPRNITFTELSAQNLIDCTNHCNCKEGRPSFALVDVGSKLEGIQDEQSYPYEGKEGTCRQDKSKSVIKNTEYRYLKVDEKELADFVANYGPVAAAIDGSNPSFKSYKGGIYFEKWCAFTFNRLNDYVLIVGFGTDPIDGDYWILKNSFGEDWGEKGYMRLARNRGNNCGIASYPLIPTF